MTGNRTPCEEYGHRFDLDGETFDACLDCGEPRDGGESVIQRDSPDGYGSLGYDHTDESVLPPPEQVAGGPSCGDMTHQANCHHLETGVIHAKGRVFIARTAEMNASCSFEPGKFLLVVQVDDNDLAYWRGMQGEANRDADDLLGSKDSSPLVLGTQHQQSNARIVGYLPEGAVFHPLSDDG